MARQLARGICCLLLLVVARAGSIIRIGNEPIPSPDGLEWANTTFMLKDIILEGGVLFAYSAYFLSDLPVRFQIWRPVDEDNLRFKLVHETRYRARNWDTKVDIYLSDLPGGKCVPVANGDRLGVAAEDAPSAISYYFDGDDPNTLTHPLRDGETFALVGDTVRFDALTFPYEYSVAAFVDTVTAPNMNHTTVDCPFHDTGADWSSPIPPYNEVLIGPRGPPGPPGPPGPQGPAGEVITIKEPSWPVREHVWHTWETLEDWRVILLILVWLALMSLMNVCCLIALLRRNNGTKQDDEEKIPITPEKLPGAPPPYDETKVDYVEYSPEDKDNLSNVEYSPEDKENLCNITV